MLYKFLTTNSLSKHCVIYDSKNNNMIYCPNDLNKSKVIFKVIGFNNFKYLKTIIDENTYSNVDINMGKTNNIGNMINFIKANERLEKIKLLKDGKI